MSRYLPLFIDVSARSFLFPLPTHLYAHASRYASDLGKAFGCPIFHVNADDVEAVNRVFELAGECRMKVFAFLGSIGFFQSSMRLQS